MGIDVIAFVKTFAVTAFYTGFGIVLFFVTFKVIAANLPFSMRKEIEEDQNTALAIIIAAVILGIAIIIAAAVHG
jgi:putative membrane protein